MRIVHDAPIASVSAKSVKRCRVNVMDNPSRSAAVPFRRSSRTVPGSTEPTARDRSSVFVSPWVGGGRLRTRLSRGPRRCLVTMGFRRYVDELARHRNRFRWVEYSVSASLMIVIIAGLTGITDVAALIALFGVNVTMIL